MRPPLPGVINCLSGGTQYSTIISAAISSFIYLISIILIYKKERQESEIDQFVFAAMAFIFPSILFFSNFGGDLLALSFLLLALVLENPFQKGISVGLASLSRYNFLLYGIIVLAKTKVKDWWKVLAMVLLIWLPWLLYNYAQTGDPFYSVLDSVFLNVQQKGLLAGLDVTHVILIIFFTVTLLLGSFLKKITDKYNLTALLAILQFTVSGIKEYRFLNVLVPAQALNTSKEKNGKVRGLIVTGLGLMILTVAVMTIGFAPGYNQPEIPIELIGDCRVMSDQWVYFYPAGIVAEPLPGEDYLHDYLAKGIILVIYQKQLYQDVNWGNYEIINDKTRLAVKPKDCAKRPEKYVLNIQKLWRGET